MLIWYFSNDLDKYDYVEKLPEQHFSVWLISNPGDTILFLLKFIEARISEWNVYVQYFKRYLLCESRSRLLCYSTIVECIGIVAIICNSAVYSTLSLGLFSSSQNIDTYNTTFCPPPHPTDFFPSS